MSLREKYAESMKLAEDLSKPKFTQRSDDDGRLKGYPYVSDFEQGIGYTVNFKKFIWGRERFLPGANGKYFSCKCNNVVSEDTNTGDFEFVTVTDTGEIKTEIKTLAYQVAWENGQKVACGFNNDTFACDLRNTKEDGTNSRYTYESKKSTLKDKEGNLLPDYVKKTDSCWQTLTFVFTHVDLPGYDLHLKVKIGNPKTFAEYYKETLDSFLAQVSELGIEDDSNGILCRLEHYKTEHNGSRVRLTVLGEGFEPENDEHIFIREGINAVIAKKKQGAKSSKVMMTEDELSDLIDKLPDMMTEEDKAAWNMDEPRKSKIIPLYLDEGPYGPVVRNIDDLPFNFWEDAKARKTSKK